MSLVEDLSLQYTHAFHGWSDELLSQFKKEYEEKGPSDFAFQIRYLSELAEHYFEMGKADLSVDDAFAWVPLIKAHTLFNSCAARCENDVTQQNHWSEKAFDVQKCYWQGRSDAGWEEQRAITAELKDELASIRSKCGEMLSEIDSVVNDLNVEPEKLQCEENLATAERFCEQVELFGPKVNEDVVKFASLLIEHSVSLCSKVLNSDDKFAVMAIGSIAKGESTTYSDLEYIFLLEKPIADKSAFEFLAVTTYFLIGNLQETKLKYMDISELKGWFDDKCTNGFKIDGLQEGAGNIPTGNGYGGDRNHNKFICSVEELVAKYEKVLNHEAERKEALRGDLSAMLTNTIYLYGDRDVHNNYIQRVAMVKPSESRLEATRKMLVNDIKKYNFVPDQNFDKKRDLKSDFYRYPSIVVNDLKVLLEASESSSLNLIDEFYRKKSLSKDLFRSLRLLLCSAIYIRHAAYHHNQSQNDAVSMLLPLKPGKSLWYVPIGLTMHMCLHLVPVKEKLGEAFGSGNIDLNKLKEPLEYSAMLSAADVSFFSCDNLKFLDYIEKHRQDQGPVDLEHKFKQMEALRRTAQWSKLDALVKETAGSLGKSNENDLYNHALCGIFQGHSAYERGDYEDAEHHYQGSFINFMKAFNKDKYHDEIARCYRGLGLVKRRRSDLSKACGLFNLELSIYQALNKKQAQNHKDDIAGCYMNIANCQTAMGQYDAAEKNYFTANKMYTELIGEETVHRDMALVYISHGNILSEKNQHDRAIEVYEKALEIDKILYLSTNNQGAHQDIARDLNNLGVAYMDKAGVDNLQKAIEYLQQSLDILKELHKEQQGIHPEIASRNRNLGLAYSRLGKYSEAILYYEEALKIYRVAYPSESGNRDEIADLYTSIGHLYLQMKESDKSREAYQKSLTILEEMFGGRNHKKLADAYNNAVYCHFGENPNYELAKQNAGKSLQMFKNILGGGNHREIANCYDTLGDIFKEEKDYENATTHYTKAVEMYESMPECKTTAELAKTYENLADICVVSGKESFAKAWYVKAKDAFHEACGPDHPAHIRVQESLSKLLKHSC